MKKVALFIGIDHYGDTRITPLRCAARDARELAGVFKHKFGFETTVLTHEELGNAAPSQQRSLNRELWRIGEKLKPGDLFVLFFAGHGKTLGAANAEQDQIFLLPNADATVVESGLPGEGVLSYRALLAQTASWQGVARAFIFDACRLPIKLADAHSRDIGNEVAFAGEAVYRGLAFAPARSSDTRPGVAVLNSCMDQQRAEELDSYELGHGLFSAALLETLQEYEQRQLNVVLDDLLVEALAVRMRQLARQHTRRDTAQRPLRVGAALSLFEPTRAAAPVAVSPTPAPVSAHPAPAQAPAPTLVSAPPAPKPAPASAPVSASKPAPKPAQAPAPKPAQAPALGPR